jgi:hypothetical protein
MSYKKFLLLIRHPPCCSYVFVYSLFCYIRIYILIHRFDHFKSVVLVDEAPVQLDLWDTAGYDSYCRNAKLNVSLYWSLLKSLNDKDVLLINTKESCTMTTYKALKVPTMFLFFFRNIRGIWHTWSVELIKHDLIFGSESDFPHRLSLCMHEFPDVDLND